MFVKTISSLNSSAWVFLETLNYLKLSKNIDLDLNDLKQSWALSVLSRLNVEIDVIGKPDSRPGIIFVGNHISYLDIPLLVSKLSNLCFVAKSQVKHWPVIGKAARRVDTVFVGRKHKKSRGAAKLAVQQAIENGKRLAVFPSGTTCMDERKPWRKGAFDVAQKTNCLVQPFRLNYSPLRTVAYIDNDTFPIHLYRLFMQTKIKARLEFHEPVRIQDAQKDCLYWQEWAKGKANV